MDGKLHTHGGRASGLHHPIKELVLMISHIVPLLFRA